VIDQNILDFQAWEDDYIYTQLTKDAGFFFSPFEKNNNNKKTFTKKIINFSKKLCCSFS